MKYLFVVQGEGRGHFTQALSLKAMLEKNGHEVVGVMVGKSNKRILPSFFTEKIGTEVQTFKSPNFMPTPKGKSSPLLISILYNLLFLPVYLKSLLTIRQTISEKEPDVVVNFYELLCGVTFGLLRPNAEMINIAHQYYFLTPEFKYQGEKNFQFRMLNFYSRMTSLGSSKILALSFRPGQNRQYGSISIVPPLLRNEVLNTIPREGRYIHGYMLNSGYAVELERWSEEHLDQPLHFFWDKRGVEKTTMLTPMFAIHQLSDSLFLHYMSGCKAYATTGGFESVCEAMYLQKPILMVPTHIEQECNVMDAMKAGAGISAVDFDIDRLLNYLPNYQKTKNFTYWVRSAESIFSQELSQSEYPLPNVWASI